jgi:hypothetical protein
MKLNSSVSKFLTNKWVLKVVALLALFNVMGYVVMGKFNPVLQFIVFAVLIRYFSKNMTIVLGVPLIIVNLLAMKGNVSEGMESGATNPETKQNQINKIVKKNDANNSSTISDISIAAAANNAAQSKQGFETGRRKNKGTIEYASNIEDAYTKPNMLGGEGADGASQKMQVTEGMHGGVEELPITEGMYGEIEDEE